MSSRHSIPPTTTAQYLTAGLIVIFLEVLFVVLSNEAQVLTDNEVEWYKPWRLISFANDQLKINNCDMPISSITLQPPKSKPNQLYVFAVDQTCPSLMETFQQENFENFIDGAKIEELIVSKDEQVKMLTELSNKEFHNQITTFLIENMLGDTFSYGILDYSATNNAITALDWRKRPNDGGKCIFSYPDKNVDVENDKIAVLCHACNNKPVSHKGDQSNFSDFFSALNTILEATQKDKRPSFEFHLIIISDFVHETEGLTHASYENVKKRLIDFSDKRDDVKSLKLITMPFRKANDPLAAERKKLVQYIKGNMQASGIKTDAIDLDDFDSVEDLRKSLLIIGTQICNFPKDSIVMYYPFATREHPDEAYGKIQVVNKGKSLCWKLDCNNAIAETAEIPLMKCYFGSDKGTNILVNARMYTETKPSIGNMTLSFQSSNFANNYSDLHIDIMSDKYSIMPVPIKFVKKMTHIEAGILGASTLLILIFFVYWLMLLLSGRSFYDDVTGDWVSKITKFIRDKYFWAGAYVSIVIPIVICWALIYTLLSALDKSAQIWLMCIVIAYVGITSAFHITHLCRQKKAIEQQTFEESKD